MPNPRARFADRRASGRLLSAQLVGLGLRHPAVIALCPGGIHVGFEVARALSGELDLIATQDDGSDNWVPGLSAVELFNRTVVIVDDGSTPLSDILDTVSRVRADGATRITLAVPIVLDEALPALKSACDSVVYLVQTSSGERPADRYDEFHDVSRREAVRFLRDARDPHRRPAPPVSDSVAFARDAAKTAMRGAAVLLVEQDSFLAEYIKTALQAAGASIVGPFESADEVEAYSNGLNVQAVVAAVDADLPGGAAAAARLLSHLNVPFVVVGTKDPLWSEPMLSGRPFLARPFAAFQLIDALGQVLAASRFRPQ